MMPARRLPALARAALALAAAAAVARLAGAVRGARMADLPPGLPRAVAAGVWVVDGVMRGPAGAPVPVRMTVLRLPDGGLLLHSPIRFGAGLDAALRPLGRVAHLVAPSTFHWMFLRGWQAAYPGATAWAAPGLRERRQVRRAGLRLDREMGDGAPAEWGGAVETATVPAALGVRETALLHRPSRTLLLTDLVLNLCPARLPAAVRPLARLLGVTAPDGVPPPWVRALFVARRREAAAVAEALLRREPERVIFAHGDWFERDATLRLRRSWRWLLD